LNYFIFQGNPDIYDIDTYISNNTEILWRVKQRKKDVHIGNIVFIWRAKGKNNAISGVVAMAKVLTEPKKMKEDAESQKYWKDDLSHTKEETMVVLKIIKKCHTPSETIRKSSLQKISGLDDLKIGQGTNFLLSQKRGKKLRNICLGKNRKNFMLSQGATCNNWISSWSFINKEDKTIIFGAWDIDGEWEDNTVGNITKIFDEAWEYNHARTRKNSAYPQSLEHIRLIEEEGYQLMTFPMERGGEGKDDAAIIKEFTPVLTVNTLVKKGTKWYAKSDHITSAYSWTILDSNTAVKSLDKSAFLHGGTGIPTEIRGFFDIENMKSGERTSVSLNYNSKVFDAHFEMGSQDTPRSRLFWSSEFSKELRNLFPQHYTHYTEDKKSGISELLLSFEKRDGVHQYSLSFSGDIQLETVQQDVHSEVIEESGPAQKEGAIKEYYGKRYERNPANRKKAIKIHGLTCKACNFNFEEVYGERGTDFIEVHHLKPICTFEGEAQAIDPKTDLLPLCSNCHRMIHRRLNNIMTIEQLQEIMKSNVQ